MDIKWNLIQLTGWEIKAAMSQTNLFMSIIRIFFLLSVYLWIKNASSYNLGIIDKKIQVSLAIRRHAK